MADYTGVLVMIAVGVVGLVVIAGFFNMLRGGDGAPARSQNLMRWRVALQFAALLVILATLYVRGR